jgi:phosphoribosyl-AMP cyclohydrolase
MDLAWIESLKYDANGLIPAIIQDHADGEVLMMAWMNKASLTDTVKTGKTHFWSRSRQKYWMKGEESGNVQNVKGLWFDCDADALVIKVEQVGGAACHTGHRSCFYMAAGQEGAKDSAPLVFDPAQVYKK